MVVAGDGGREHASPIATVTAVVTRIRHGALEVLLTRRAIEPFCGMWCLPGGHIDRFEPASQAVVREVREETGLVFNGDYFGSFDETFQDLDVHNVVTAYAGRGTGELKPQSAEVSEIRWVPLNDARACTLAFKHKTVLEAFAGLHATSKVGGGTELPDNGKEGLLEEFRALRAEMTTIFNARLWGTATYLVLVASVLALAKGNLGQHHLLVLMYASIPFVLHTAYRERARIRAGVYIRLKIEPHVTGLDWERFLDSWRTLGEESGKKPVSDRLVHMIGIGGLYVLVLATSAVGFIVSSLSTVASLEVLSASAIWPLISFVVALLLAGWSLWKFFAQYDGVEKMTVKACEDFLREPGIG